jgi:predicted DNA-binding protein (MmcQ/YjbR family)
MALSSRRIPLCRRNRRAARPQIVKPDRRRVSPEAFEGHCLGLPAVTLTVQWGGTSVFKVGGKIFALANGLVERRASGFMFKVSDMAYELLIEAGLARPAPYLARAKWVQLTDNDVLPDAELAAYLEQAHGLIAAKLTRATRRELGLG